MKYVNSHCKVIKTAFMHSKMIIDVFKTTTEIRYNALTERCHLYVVFWNYCGFFNTIKEALNKMLDLKDVSGCLVVCTNTSTYGVYKYISLTGGSAYTVRISLMKGCG
jgi:hypothetical protein